jgi:hypothetical protein
MLRLLRAERSPREGALQLPALLLDWSYVPVVVEGAERRNATGIATLAAVVPLYNDKGGSCYVHYY